MTNDASKTRPSSRWATVALIATLLVSLPLVGGFFGWLHPALDSLSHFRAHFGALLALGAIALLHARVWLNGIMALAMAGLAIATTLPEDFRPGTRANAVPAPSAEPLYKLMQINLRWDNPEPQKVLSLIAGVRPDVITLDEVSAAWRERLALIAAAYPERLDCGGDAKRGSVMILSRRPFLATDASACAPHRGMAVATVDFGGRAVEVAAVHLDWPWPFGQMAEVEALAPKLAALGDVTIAAGDFNAVQWSATVRAFVREGGFAEPVSLGPTWIYKSLPKSLRRLAGIELDHVMAKPGLRIHSARVLEDAGSDHLPLLVEFSIPSRKDEEGVVAVAEAREAAPTF